MSLSKHPRYFINALEKGLTILAAFSKLEATPLGLAEVARLIHMNLPTASRYLRTLTDLGYLIKDPSTKKYSPSPKVMALGLAFLNNMDLRTRIHPHVVTLSQEYKVSAQFAILDETEVVFIERIRGPGLVDINLTAGSRLPAYCSALGRAILAHLDPDQASKLIDKMDLKPRTSRTITNKKELMAELERSRRRGYAQNIQEIAWGFANFAAPIYINREVEGAIGVTFSADMMKEDDFVDAVIKGTIAAAVKASIGY